MIAVAGATVLYAIVLAIGRDPVPQLEAGVAPRLQRPPAPQPLPSAPEFAKPSPTEQEVPVTRQVTVPVRVVAAELSGVLEDAGVATFDTETSADFRWYPLREAVRGADGSWMVSAMAACDSRTTITFAAGRTQARHGYLSRVDVRCQPVDSQSTAPVELSGRLTPVHFQLPPDADRAGPLRLRRIDDPDWVSMSQGASGLSVARGSTLTIELGDGAYELVDPLATDRSQRFDVPTMRTVTIDAVLLPAPDDRR